MDAIPAYFYKLLNAHTKKAGVQSGGYGKPNANLLGGEAQLQHSVDDEKLAQLQEMFGLMTMEQLKEALVNKNGDVGLAALSISELEANIDQNGSMLGDDVDRPLGEEAGFNLDQRRNVFDNDRFDVFNSEDFDESVVLMDKQHRNQQNALANAGVSLRQKTLAAAAAILLDEDEYDDSYDSLDVGAVTVTGDDEEIDEGDQRQQGQKREQEQSHVQQSRQQHEVYLSSLVVSNPDIFLTSQNTRKSKARKELREKTGLTDEQVEGWYKMLMKTPAKLDKIKSEFYLSNPNRENTNKAETDSMQANSGTRTSAAKKTGPAFTAKPEKDIKSTAQRKADQQHKSTRANHNRKAAHSRKYASIQ
ncbi:CUE domain-containing protein 3 [Zancudomyces culisetae]|uniref:CUE domain-containing protein 3 n=1 Tax=Zancudomyces culisetae TaxID=1213189 RepID=A0A1R1PFU8_ZANCU|nr:CUE domain-containing protein 3 [Zancudomyces culisetae]|eukprot:OMH79854.1 CUE domain-containing protein 3 [Zancudomyces culisetae]